MLSHCCGGSLVALGKQYDFPHSEGAALDAGLAAGWGVAEIKEGEFGAAEAFFDEAGAGIAGGPSMTAGHALEALAAVGGEAHADDCGLRCGHRGSETVGVVSIVTHKDIEKEIQ